MAVKGFYHFFQGIGSLPHGGNDNQELFPLMRTQDAGEALDPFHAVDAGASELENFHYMNLMVRKGKEHPIFPAKDLLKMINPPYICCSIIKLLNLSQHEREQKSIDARRIHPSATP